MEDAVGLYLQLGKEYPNVVVRDGKTGADFLTNLLTDKRLLPYLEPSRYPMPPRMKAEQRANRRSNVNYGAVRDRTARAICSRCTAATGSSSTSTSRATAPGRSAASTAATGAERMQVPGIAPAA